MPTFPLENYAAKFAERNSNMKYYFIDNGLLHIFLTDANTSLLENIVAIQLYKNTEMRSISITRILK